MRSSKLQYNLFIGLIGLTQFIAFLNNSSESGALSASTNSPRVGTRDVSSPRARGGGGEGSSTGYSTGTYTALPRPKNGSTAMSRKSSFSSQLTDGRISAQSMTPPETPRSGSGRKMVASLDSRHHDTRVESSLASIASSGHSGSSTPDTLQRTEDITTEDDQESASGLKNGERHSKMVNSTSKLPKRTQSLRDSANGFTRSSSRPDRSSVGTHRPPSGTSSRKPTHDQSLIEQNNSRGTQDTASSQSLETAFTTIGNKTSNHGTNSDYLLIKSRSGTESNRTILNPEL